MPSRKKQPIQPILCEESSNSLKENSVNMAQCHRESTLSPRNSIWADSLNSVV